MVIALVFGPTNYEVINLTTKVVAPVTHMTIGGTAKVDTSFGEIVFRNDGTAINGGYVLRQSDMKLSPDDGKYIDDNGNFHDVVREGFGGYKVIN